MLAHGSGGAPAQLILKDGQSACHEFGDLLVAHLARAGLVFVHAPPVLNLSAILVCQILLNE